MKSINEHIKSGAINLGEFDGIPFWIVPGPMAGMNGYVCFPSKPVKEPDYHGILRYVPVHGGITYCQHDGLGSVYGFDTAHYDSESVSRNDPAWVASQCEIMIRAIKLAATLEDAYLLAEGDNAKRAEICQQLCDLQPAQSMNFHVSLSLLSGNL